MVERYLVGTGKYVLVGGWNLDLIVHGVILDVVLDVVLYGALNRVVNRNRVLSSA